MIKNITIIFLVVINVVTYAQLESFIRFPLQDSTEQVYHSLILQAQNGDVLFFYLEKDSIYYARSTDNGISWNESLPVAPILEWLKPLQLKFVGIVTKSSRIIIFYKSKDEHVSYIYSDDNGYNWSAPNIVDIGIFALSSELVEVNDSTLWFLYSRSDLYYIESKDNGETWSSKKLLLDKVRGASVESINDSVKIMIGNNTETGTLVKYVSHDSGLTWTDSVSIITTKGEFNNRYYDFWINLIKQNDTTFVLTYYGEKYENDIYKSDVFVSTSFDGGDTWTDPQIINNYIGENRHPQTTLIGKDIYITFSSDRYEKIQAWYGILGKSIDTDTPPNIYKIDTDPSIPLSDQDVVIKAKIIEDKQVQQVNLSFKYNDGNYFTLEMFDDGTHGDDKTNDLVYANIINVGKGIDSMKYFVSATDNDLLTAISEVKAITYEHNNMFEEYYLEVNNVKLPLGNNGIISDLLIGGHFGGKFEENSFLFSSGFGLSGYSNGILWGNGVMTASRIEDYIEGPVDDILDSNYYKIYVLSSTSVPFGKSWQTWKYAVELGAKFYDGDGDGIYNPVDKNGNGYWDPNEDRPDILGDITTWCVFNDGVSQSERRFSNVNPQGIEVKQTVFAYSPETFQKLSNVIFIRYTIENSGVVSDILDSVYFSAWADPDIGKIYYRDLTGCDTLLKSGFTYKNIADDEYGNNPPSFMITLLQGPLAYIPGKSFVDNNQNGVFDFGVDTPLDTAKYFLGPLLKKKIYPGAKNLKMTSFVHYMKSHPTQGDPDNEMQLRNFLVGKGQKGNYINPCDWSFGEVLNMNCEDINPLYMYSGDPITQTGWINSEAYDQRMMVNTGPFVLEKGKPIELIVAYVVGRGIDALNSITVAKNIAKDAIGFYSTNFQYIPVGVKENKLSKIPTKFVLEQNYPNPFNPSTTIKYSIPNLENQNAISVQLKVFDVLGREIATLVNKKQSPGNYEVRFNARSISSGVYYYQLKARDFIQTKKMLLLK